MVSALTFDVFGTCVDWRGGIVAACERFGARAGVRADWAALAVRWRRGYRPAMNRVLAGELPWTTFSALHRMMLDEIAAEFGLASLEPEQRDELTSFWTQLPPWPDTVPGLTRLKSRFAIAPLSNGNFAMLVGLAKFAGLPWDCILSAEFAKRYKPDPEVYRMASAYLETPLENMVMVAAHNYDLAAARELGMQTAFVARPFEYGPGQTDDLAPAGPMTYTATDFNDLADQLECP